MTQYLPHSSKKLAVLQRKELALFKLIEDGESQQAINSAAEAVREARIRAIEASDASDGPRYSDRSISDRQIDMVRGLPIADVLAYFGYP